MTRTRTIMAGMMGGVLAFAGLASLLLLVLLGQAAAQTNPGGNHAPAAAPPAGSSADPQHYADLLVQNLATKLGVSQAQLNTAFTAAANDTIAQAQRDGALTTDQAAQAQAQVGKGLSTLLVTGIGGPQSGSKGVAVMDDGGRMEAVLSAVQKAVPTLFGMTSDQFMSAITGGQTLAALEQAHHVTTQQVHDAALHAARTALDAGVASGKWTQAQADETYQAFSQNVDNFLPKLVGGGAMRVGIGAGPGASMDNNPKSAIMSAVGSVLAPLFNMSADDLFKAQGAGQALHALAQAHNVTDQQVKDKLLPAVRAALNAGVGQGHWTQAQADQFYTDFSSSVDSFLTNTAGGNRNDPAQARLDTVNTAAVTAVGHLLGMSADALQTAVNGGQSLHGLGAAHNVTDQQMRDAAFAAAHSTLAAGVASGKWTQGQADETSAAFGKVVDKYLPTGGTQ